MSRRERGGTTISDATKRTRKPHFSLTGCNHYPGYLSALSHEDSKGELLSSPSLQNTLIRTVKLERTGKAYVQGFLKTNCNHRSLRQRNEDEANH